MTYTNYTEYKQAVARGERGIKFINTNIKSEDEGVIVTSPWDRGIGVAATQASHLDTNG